MNDIAEKVPARCDELIYIYIWRAFAYLESERKGSIFLSLTVEQRKIAVFLGPFYLGTAAMRQLRRSNALL